MPTVAELKAKLEKYGVKTAGLLKADLEEILTRVQSQEETYYDSPEFIECVPMGGAILNMIRAKAQLQKQGYTIIKIPGWSDRYVTAFKELIESNFPFRFDDPRTWLTKNLPFNLHGIFKYEMGHTKFHWDIRELCYPIFVDLFDGEEDLLCSFDSLNVSYPRRGNADAWLHLDTDRRTKHMQCYQGVVNFLPNGPHDGGLIVVEKSHLVLDEYLAKHPTEGVGWTQVQMGDPLLKDLNVYKICLNPGEICIWDSRTIHCNMQPQSDNLRMACYVSMQPRSYATDKQIEKRIAAFEAGRLTGHWVGGSLFGINSGRYANTGLHVQENVNVSYEDLNPLQRRLVGYKVKKTTIKL